MHDERTSTTFRIRRPRRGAIALTVLLLGAATMGFTRQAGPAERPFDLERRLAELDPNRPVMYIELAEEIALGLDRGDSADRRLARRLYGLAGRLDPSELGASAALGIASLVPELREKERYWAAAALLDPGVTGLLRPTRPEVDGETALGISNAFGQFRSGRPARLRSILDDRHGEAILRHWDATLPGGVDWLRRQAESAGRSRPVLTRSDITSMVRVEVALLDLERPGWSTLLATERDPAMVDLKPDRVLELFVDDESASRPLYRGGEWVSR